MVRELGDCGRQRREGDGNAHGDTSVTSQQRVCSDGQGRWAAERDGRGIRTRYHESRFGEQEVGRRESIVRYQVKSISTTPAPCSMHAPRLLLLPQRLKARFRCWLKGGRVREVNDGGKKIRSLL